MIELPIKGGLVALIDDCDADLAAFRWSPQRWGRNTYASRQMVIDGKRKSVSLHRLILSRMLGIELTRHQLCDHENLNGLDCRRENLRLATHSQNHQNRAKARFVGTQYKGVTKMKYGERWQAMITVDKKQLGLGFYDSPEMAAIAYNHAAKQHFREFARFNDIPGWEQIVPTPLSKRKYTKRTQQTALVDQTTSARQMKR